MVACALVGLLITAIVTIATAQRVRADAAAETNTRLLGVGTGIDRQVSRYAETLFGLRGAFALHPDLTRSDFAELVDINALTRRVPGAQSVTFNRYVPDGDLAAFVRRTRAQVPGFSVYPASHDRDHVIVDYVEPERPRSVAQGLDIATDRARRTAYLFARDSGELSATTPLVLVQDPTSSGFLLMLAAYDVSPVPVTTPARIRHFVGVLVAVFTTDTMIAQAEEAGNGLGVSIYDAGATVDTPRDHPRPTDWVVGRPRSDYTNYADIDVGSRRWRIVTDHPVAASMAAPLATATTGVALTLLVAGMVGAMLLSRRRAIRLAETMTVNLRLSQQRLRATNEALRGFIDVAAHDLRTPLVSIAGFSAMLNDNEMFLTEDERQRAFGSIERQADHMGLLIEDLLTMSSIDGGGLQPRPQIVLVADVVADSVDAAGHQVATIGVECDPDLKAFVDPHHLRRILDNYVHNALKYGAAPIRITARRTGDQVEVRVSDEGPGVPATFVGRLFDKFSRAETPETNTQRGTGLGLSIVRGLAEVNGGQAAYEPNVPHGSCFIVRLPSAP